MNDKIFFDTNVLIYAYSIDEPTKRSAVKKLIDNNQEIVISTQVINEFINVMNRKRKIEFSDLSQTIDELIQHFVITQITVQTIDQALKIANKYHYSYFDSLILASAIENNCSIVYTEDMHNTQLIQNKLKIHNLFK